MSRQIERRHVLATIGAVGAAALAGCADRSNLRMDAVDEAALVSDAARSIPADRVRSSPEAVRSTATEGVPAEYGRLVEAIETGAIVERGRTPDPPLPPARPVRVSLVEPPVEPPVEYDGEYYTIEHADTDRRSTFRTVLRFKALETLPAGADPIDYESLPAVDRAIVDALLETDVEPGTYEHVRRDVTGSERATSVLLSTTDTRTVSVDGRQFSVSLRRSSERRTYTYRYEARPVAATRAQFVAWLREHYRFDLTGLREAERTIVDDSIEGGYTEDEDDPLTELARRFFVEAPLSLRNGYGDWFVRYDGTEYVAHLDVPSELR